MAKHTLEELNNSSREELITMILMMEGQMEQLNENIEHLLEQIRIANNYRFGKRSEKMDMIAGRSPMPLRQRTKKIHPLSDNQLPTRHCSGYLSSTMQTRS